MFNTPDGLICGMEECGATDLYKETAKDLSLYNFVNSSYPRIMAENL